MAIPIRTLQLPILFGMRGLQAVAMFLIWIVLAHRLEPEGLGVFSYIQAWILTSVSFAQIGFPLLVVRETATFLGKRDYGSILSLYGIMRRSILALSTASALVLLALAFSGFMPRLDPLVLAVGLPAIYFLAQMTSNEGMVRGFGLIVAGQVSQLLVRPWGQLVLLAMLMTRAFAFTPLTAMATVSLASFAAWVISHLILRQCLRPVLKAKPVSHWDRWKSSLLKLSATGIIAVLGPQATILIMGTLSSPSEIAYFSLAMQITVLLSIGLIVVNSQQATAFSTIYLTGDLPKLQYEATRGCRISLAFALVLAAPLLLFGEEFLVFVFGESYRNATAPVIILALGQLINAAVGSVSVLLITIRQEKQALSWQAIALTTQLLLAALLTPILGATGGAIAASVSLILWNLALLRKVFLAVGVISLPFDLRKSGSSP